MTKEYHLFWLVVLNSKPLNFESICKKICFKPAIQTGRRVFAARKFRRKCHRTKFLWKFPRPKLGLPRNSRWGRCWQRSLPIPLRSLRQKFFLSYLLLLALTDYLKRFVSLLAVMYLFFSDPILVFAILSIFKSYSKACVKIINTYSP